VLSGGGPILGSSQHEAALVTLTSAGSQVFLGAAPIRMKMAPAGTSSVSPDPVFQNRSDSQALVAAGLYKPGVQPTLDSQCLYLRTNNPTSFGSEDPEQEGLPWLQAREEDRGLACRVRAATTKTSSLASPGLCCCGTVEHTRPRERRRS